MKEIINQGLCFWNPLGDYCPLDPSHTFYMRINLPQVNLLSLLNATSKTPLQ